MNPYYYLFYKLSRFLNKKGNNELAVIYALTVLIGWNVGIIYIKVLPINEENFKSSYKYGLIGFGAVLFTVNSILFLNKKRVKGILKRYKGETNMGRNMGNFLVILYVILSLALIVFI